MRYTFFDTPLFTPVVRGILGLWLKLVNYRPAGEVPQEDKFIIIGVPHTSNWDFIYFLAIALQLRVQPMWMGKDSLFTGPFRKMFQWMGGIPIDRTRSNNTVEQAIELFNANKKMILVLAPEGTRSHSPYWKSGFYHIALGAKVPISMGFLDYKVRKGGLGPLYYPTGDTAVDVEAFRTFYRTVTARYPEKTGEIAFRESS